MSNEYDQDLAMAFDTVEAPTLERLCHQCGTLHIIPEGAICLKAAPEVQQEVLRIAMRAQITEEWVRENLIPIRRIIQAARHI